MRFQSPGIPRVAHSRLHHYAQRAADILTSGPLEAEQLLRFYSTTCARHANRSLWQPERPHNPPPFHTHPKLHTESLRETLEAHRDANRAFLIRKNGPPILDRSKQQSNKTNDNATSTHQTVSRPKVDNAHWRKVRVLRFRSLEEYEGKSEPLVGDWAKEAGLSWSSKHPWLGFTSIAEESARPSTARDALGKEIMSFEAYIKPDAEESAASEVALRELQDTVKALDPALTTSLVGSRANGLARPFSDIDVNISFPVTSDKNPFSLKSPWNKKTTRKAANLIQKVHEKLQPAKVEHHPRFKPKELVLRTRVPVASGHHVPSGLKYQFQCTDSSQGSLAYAKLSQAELPTLRPLFLVIQQLLEMRGLTNPSEGGVGSYTLLMMVVVSLRMRKGPQNDSDIGAQLIHFLEFFAAIDFYNTGIIVQPPMLIEKRALAHAKSSQKEEVADFDDSSVEIRAARQLLTGKYFQEKPFLMLLQDPANALNNLGSSTWKIKHIQATLRDLKERLETLMNVWSAFKNIAQGKSTAVKAQLPELSLLTPLVGGNYTKFEKTRTKLRSFGRSMRTAQPSDPAQADTPALEETADTVSNIQSETPPIVNEPSGNPVTSAHKADTKLDANLESDDMINGLMQGPTPPEGEAFTSTVKPDSLAGAQSLQGKKSSTSPVRRIQPFLNFHYALDRPPPWSEPFQDSESSEPPSPADAVPTLPKGLPSHSASDQRAPTFRKYPWSDFVNKHGGPVSFH